MWSAYSWKQYRLLHNPIYDETYDIGNIISILSSKSSIVDYQQVDKLLSLLSNLVVDNKFILQIGECAESFSQSNGVDIGNRLNFMDSLVNVLGASKDVVLIGRIAGQYAKPRTQETEAINDKIYNVYMGDMINDFNHGDNLRKPDPNRMLMAYDCAKFTHDEIKKHHREVFTSHEALILEYESALTRLVGDKYYNLSAHFLWLGERTRFINSAHVEYLRGISNPIGIKISPLGNIDEIISIIKTINPNNTRGKIILICRIGAGNMADFLPKLIKSVLKEGLECLWMCDPMHGNTIAINGYKVRKLSAILDEINTFYTILNSYNIYFSGIHLEATHGDVNECVDIDVDESSFNGSNYQSYCDPRLNNSQSLLVIENVKNKISNYK